MTAVASACLIIDTSFSMTDYGYVANTVIDSKAFVTYALAGDAIAVVNYDVNGNNCYAPNGQMAVVDSTLSQLAAATAAISGLTFQGTCTNIGGGIQAAYNLLNTSSITPKATVLLTDGEQNCGTPPLNVVSSTTPPVYSCAMGPHSDQKLLQQIASTTNAVYYYMPYPFNMMQIYNQIRAIQPRTRAVQNYMAAMTTSQQSLLLPASITSTSELQQVGVVWSDSTYVYSNNSSPTGNQLYIVLYQPNGQIYPAAPTRQGAGYVVFDVPNPQVGTWNVYVQYAGSVNALYVTTGVFEFTPAGASEIRLAVDAPAVLAAGSALNVKARLLHEDEEPVTIQTITAEVVAPVLSIKNALATYRDEIGGVRPILPEPSHDEDTPQRRLALLHRLHLPVRDILPHRTTAAPMVAADDGSHQLIVPDTRQAGSYNIMVRATGYSQKSKSPVQRTQLVSVLVNDK